MLNRRIIGTEIEHGLLAELTPGNPPPPGMLMEEIQPGMLQDVSAPVIGRAIINCLPKGFKMSNSMLNNGARFYCDIGAHPEYSTPECDTLSDVAACEIGSERIVNDTLQKGLVANGIAKRIALSRRVIDPRGNTWGYHENYQMEAKLDPNKANIQGPKSQSAAFTLLALHLATRNIFAGAGAIELGPDGKRHFAIGQKALKLTCDYSDSTTEEKPLVNQRDKPLADPEQWRRLHVTSGDHTMLPRATIMKLGTTSLVVGLMEEGMKLSRDFTFAPNTLHLVARQVAQDPTCKEPLVLADGSTTTALEIQRALLAAAKQLKGLSSEYLQVLAEWERVCNVIEKDPMELRGHYDWPTKLHKLEQYMREQNAKRKPDEPVYDLDHYKVRGFDLMWDRIDVEGLGIKVRSAMKDKGWMPSQERIDYLRNNAPQNTRARLRALVMNALWNLNPKMSWYRAVVSYGAEKKTFEFKDPQSASHSGLEEFIAKVQAPGHVIPPSYSTVDNDGLMI